MAEWRARGTPMPVDMRDVAKSTATGTSQLIYPRYAARACTTSRSWSSDIAEHKTETTESLGRFFGQVRRSRRVAVIFFLLPCVISTAQRSERSGESELGRDDATCSEWVLLINVMKRGCSDGRGCEDDA